MTSMENLPSLCYAILSPIKLQNFLFKFNNRISKFSLNPLSYLSTPSTDNLLPNIA